MRDPSDLRSGPVTPLKKTISLSEELVPVAKDKFFENLKELMRAQEVADVFGISIHTIYSWKAKSKRRAIPNGLFLKFNRQLYVRTEVLRKWISSQNQSAL